MILLKAGSSSSVWFFSNGYSVEYLFMATLCLTIGVNGADQPEIPDGLFPLPYLFRLPLGRVDSVGDENQAG